MPTEFRCTSCSLQFAVGWFHYHEFATGYGSQTLLVCKDCGTQHAIEIALRNRGPENFAYRDVVLASVGDDARVTALRLIRSSLGCTPSEAQQRLRQLPVRLRERLLQFQIDEWRHRNNTTGLSIEYPVVDTDPNPDYGPIQNDRLLGAGVPQTRRNLTDLEQVAITLPLTGESTIDLTIQRCSSCSAVGTLVDQYAAALPCPNCKQPALRELSSWIT